MILELPKETGYILHEKASRYHGTGAGFLSIKSFYNGQAHYSSEGGHHVANEHSYLILNHSQPYTVEIESEQPVESFCVFFAPELARMVFQSLHQPLEAALVSPAGQTSNTPQFFDRTYPHDALLSPALQKLRRACTTRRPETGWLVEQFHELLHLLYQVHTRTLAEVNTVPATRRATREELYRRLHYARDYADAFFTQPITVNDMAETAGLSANHLLRMFRRVFHQSPYQYIVNRRLERARHLLQSTNRSVTEICLDVGFESLGSFSWSFRRRVGVSPLEYRLQNR